MIATSIPTEEVSFRENKKIGGILFDKIKIESCV
jgi:hypothetical protein